MVSESSFSFVFYNHPLSPSGQCAGGTHPTGMHSCFINNFVSGKEFSKSSTLWVINAKTLLSARETIIPKCMKKMILIVNFQHFKPLSVIDQILVSKFCPSNSRISKTMSSEEQESSSIFSIIF